MLDRPPCRFRRGGLVLDLERRVVVEQAGHDIEATVTRSTGFDRIRGQPCMRTVSQSTLFALIDRLGRVAMLGKLKLLGVPEVLSAGVRRGM